MAEMFLQYLEHNEIMQHFEMARIWPTGYI
jgi:hypothetical protein